MQPDDTQRHAWNRIGERAYGRRHLSAVRARIRLYEPIANEDDPSTQPFRDRLAAAKAALEECEAALADGDAHAALLASSRLSEEEQALHRLRGEWADAAEEPLRRRAGRKRNGSKGGRAWAAKRAKQLEGTLFEIEKLVEDLELRGRSRAEAIREAAARFHRSESQVRRIVNKTR